MDNKLVLADTFLESLSRLDKQSRKIVLNSLSKFAVSERGNGFQLHRLDRINSDDSFRTARVNSDLRVVLSQENNRYIFLYVDHHDDAYDWAEGKFMAKSKFGALYVHDHNYSTSQFEMCEMMQYQDQAYSGSELSLLQTQNVTEKDLNKLGIPEVHTKLLIALHDEDTFLNFIVVFPQELQEALINLITGSKSMTEIYADLEDQKLEDSGLNPLEHKDSKRRFYSVSDPAELDRFSELDNEKWKLFLHPDQEALVKQNFNGPVLIEGGPGTGKTVVGMHRAVHLAQHIYPASWGKNILFCTFSRKLAAYIQQKMNQLLIQKGAPNTIEVSSVDALFYNLAKHYNLLHYSVNPGEVAQLLRETYDSREEKRPMSFFQAEYEEVIQRNQIRTLNQYLRVSRSGQGEALNPAMRTKLWGFFELLLHKKAEAKVIDFDDLAFLVYQAVKNHQIPQLFDSVVIDEAQDLSVVKFIAIQALIKQTKNNIFILSDQNQRIFKLNSWQRETQLEIRGRTFYLSLNYRTTKQIREYADKQFLHSDMKKNHIRAYKSLLLGSEPDVRPFNTSSEQYQFIANKIKELMALGMESHEIGVISPVSLTGMSKTLTEEGVKHTILQKDLYPHYGTGASLSTLQGCKGLEFRVAFIINYTQIDDELLKTNMDDDYYLQLRWQQNDCLKYVASTRAREQLMITYVQ